jgi:hypothetical protein
MTTTAHEDQYLATPELVRQPYSTEAILRRNIADMEVALRAQTELKERAEAEVSQLQRWKEDQLWIWEDVDAYARKRTTLGKSVCETALELMHRAEAAEAELAKLREQKPIKYLYRVTDCFGNDVLRDDPRDSTIIETVPLYAAPVPAPAVPAEWREFVESVPDYLSNYRDKHDHYGPVLLKEQARALLQSTPQAPAVPAEWREVMAELAADLQSACDAEHPHRDQYPSVMRKYNNDMEIVEKARALLQSAEVTK